MATDDPRVRAFAKSRRFSRPTEDRWLRLASGDRETLLRLAERLRLGENQFRDVLDWCEEIAIRDHCSIGQVLDCGPVAQTLARGLGRNDMIAALKTTLRSLRFPQLVAAETRAAELVRSLRLPRNVKLHLPDNLEGDEVRVEMTASSTGAMRETAAALERALSSPALDQIFRVLQEVP
jgi:hypothetical protein